MPYRAPYQSTWRTPGDIVPWVVHGINRNLAGGACGFYGVPVGAVPDGRIDSCRSRPWTFRRFLAILPLVSVRDHWPSRPDHRRERNGIKKGVKPK